LYGDGHSVVSDVFEEAAAAARPISWRYGGKVYQSLDYSPRYLSAREKPRFSTKAYTHRTARTHYTHPSRGATGGGATTGGGIGGGDSYDKGLYSSRLFPSSSSGLFATSSSTTGLQPSTTTTRVEGDGAPTSLSLPVDVGTFIFLQQQLQQQLRGGYYMDDDNTKVSAAMMMVVVMMMMIKRRTQGRDRGQLLEDIMVTYFMDGSMAA
jgi:hypothetical protein